MSKCLECDQPAVWIRHTQFAGSHPFCDEHARAEEDFAEETSYEFWETLEEKVSQSTADDPLIAALDAISDTLLDATSDDSAIARGIRAVLAQHGLAVVPVKAPDAAVDVFVAAHDTWTDPTDPGVIYEAWPAMIEAASNAR